jgi:hypothetical protein
MEEGVRKMVEMKRAIRMTDDANGARRKQYLLSVNFST